MERQHRELEMSVLDHTRFVRALPYLVVTAALCMCLGPWLLVRLVDWIAHHHSKQPQVKACMTGFVLSLKQYDWEYGKLPVEALATKDPHAWQRSQGAIMKLLQGQPSELNPRHILFYEPPVAKAHQYGLIHNAQGEPALVDNWGEPFYFLMDLTGDGKVPNPDPRDSKEQPFLETPIIVFSAGPDRDPNTWKDNIESWK